MQAPTVPSTDAWDTRDHFVQFYEHEPTLMASLGEFVHRAIAGDGAAIVVASASHVDALEQELRRRALDVAGARETRRLVVLDAKATLDALLVDGSPDAERFAAVIEPHIADAAARSANVAVFGEMVALLWGEEREDAAVHLEMLWNDLLARYRFSLYCAYPVAAMANRPPQSVDAVCKAHTHAIPGRAVAHAVEEQRLVGICDFERRERAAYLDNALLAAIVESSNDAIISKSLDGTITSWNAAAEQMFGYRADETVGRSVALIIPPEHRNEEAGILARLARGERIEHFETVRMRKDGSRIDVSLTISPVRDRSGRVVGASKIVRDIAERKRMEAQLRDAHRRKDEFIAVLGHELRNPLAPIRTAAEVLRRTSAGDETTAELCRMLQRQVQQMARLIDDLLDVSRITSGKIRFRRERVDLAQVVKRAIETSAPALTQRGHRLGVDLPAEPLMVEGDAARLLQMVANLLDNAVKYTPEGGDIRLSAARRDSDFELRIEDSGIGIASEMLPDIFDLFVQATRSGTDAQEGLGIGLALVRMIAEHHGGSVVASSAGAGKGSAFVVRVPAADGRSAITHSDDAQDSPMRLSSRHLQVFAGGARPGPL